MKIKTNNQPREVLTWRQLTPKEQKEFDYFNPSNIGQFFRYKGWVYDLGKFVLVDHTGIPGDWHGITADSYFSGVLVRYTSDYEQVIVGQYFC